MTFRLLPETATADVAFSASGKTLDILFESACLATSSVMADLATVNQTKTLSFTKDNEQLDGLLYDVLDELVFLKDTESLLFSAFSVKVTQGKMNKAVVEARGSKIDPERMALRNDIKAVTWHLFELKKVKAGWKAMVLLDV